MPFVIIPGLREQDVAVVQSLLMSAGFAFRLRGAIAEGDGDLILIRETDVAAIKAFLSDYRIRGNDDELFAIPW